MNIRPAIEDCKRQSNVCNFSWETEASFLTSGEEIDWGRSAENGFECAYRSDFKLYKKAFHIQREIREILKSK